MYQDSSISVVLNLFKGAEPQEKFMTTHRTPQVWLIIFKWEQTEINIFIQELLTRLTNCSKPTISI